MRKNLFATLFLFLVLMFASGVSFANSKVKICHVPPGDPGNFHTITVSEKALDAHFAHGDLAGPCSEYGEVLCDDDNACTVDAIDPQTGACMAEHPPVDCDDSLKCTVDSCDPAVGCQSAPISCDDGDACTVDVCSEFDGQCMSTAIDCGPLGVCLSDGLCDYPCDGITCEPVDQCHEPGQCVLPGLCDEGVPVPDDTPCDDGNSATVNDHCVQGICEGVVACESIVLEDVYVDQITSSSAVINWVTDVASTSQVFFGQTTGFGSETPFNSELVTFHQATLGGLRPFTIYYFAVESSNEACGAWTWTAPDLPYIFRTFR